MKVSSFATFILCGFVAFVVGCGSSAKSSFKEVEITQEELDRTAPERFQKDLDGTINYINRDSKLSPEEKVRLIEDAKSAINSRKRGQGTGP